MDKNNSYTPTDICRMVANSNIVYFEGKTIKDRHKEPESFDIWMESYWNVDVLLYDETLKILHLMRKSFNGRLKVNVDELLKYQAFLTRVNRENLSNIDFIGLDGKKMDLDPDIIKDFKLCGLNNVDYITSGFYEKGFSEK